MLKVCTENRVKTVEIVKLHFVIFLLLRLIFSISVVLINLIWVCFNCSCLSKHWSRLGQTHTPCSLMSTYYRCWFRIGRLTIIFSFHSRTGWEERQDTHWRKTADRRGKEVSRNEVLVIGCARFDRVWSMLEND